MIIAVMICLRIKEVFTMVEAVAIYSEPGAALTSPACGGGVAPDLLRGDGGGALILRENTPIGRCATTSPACGGRWRPKLFDV